MIENKKSIYLNKRMPKVSFIANLENDKYITIFAEYKINNLEWKEIVSEIKTENNSASVNKSWFFWFLKNFFSDNSNSNKPSLNSWYKTLSQNDLKIYKNSEKNIITKESVNFLQDLLKYLIVKEQDSISYEKLLISKWNFNEQISKEFISFLNSININFKQYLNIKIKKEALNTNLLNNYLALISEDFYNYNSNNYKKYFNWILELPEFIFNNWNPEQIKNKLNLISYIKNLNKLKQVDENSKKIFNEKIKVLEKNLEKVLKEEITEYYSIITNPLKNYLDDNGFWSSIDYNYFKEITSLSQKDFWITSL